MPRPQMQTHDAGAAPGTQTPHVVLSLGMRFSKTMNHAWQSSRQNREKSPLNLHHRYILGNVSVFILCNNIPCIYV